MGALFNRTRGKQGVDIIPHRELLEDLPELILVTIFYLKLLNCDQHVNYWTVNSLVNYWTVNSMVNY